MGTKTANEGDNSLVNFDVSLENDTAGNNTPFGDTEEDQKDDEEIKLIHGRFQSLFIFSLAPSVSDINPEPRNIPVQSSQYNVLIKHLEKEEEDSIREATLSILKDEKYSGLSHADRAKVISDTIILLREQYSKMKICVYNCLSQSN